MNIQFMIDKLLEAERYKRVATGENISIGMLVAALEPLEPGMPVRFESGLVPDDVSSYRGYYGDLAIEFCDYGGLNTVEKLLTRLKASLGETFQGYKGGDFVMEKATPVWSANYGDCGQAVYAVHVKDGTAYLLTRPEED